MVFVTINTDLNSHKNVQEIAQPQTPPPSTESKQVQVCRVYKPSVVKPHRLEGLKNVLQEDFKGLVFDDEVKLSSKMVNAIEHPFNFDLTLRLYKKMGLVTTIVDKYVDFIVGNGFTIKAQDDRVQKIIDDFVKDQHFEGLLRKWVKEALLTGNSFLEFAMNEGGVITDMKILCSKNMFIARNQKGEVEKYYQYNPKSIGKDPIEFSINQIAHLSLNQIGDDAYGIGVIYPMLRFIENYIKGSKDMHTILKRKANSPLWAKLGDAKEKIVPTEDDVNNFGKDMEYMNEKTEWATDPYVDLKVLDFGNVGDKFTSVLEHDMEMVSITSQIPEVMLGYGSIPEGLAREQKEGFEKRAHSIQIEVERVVEQDIFKRVMETQEIMSVVDFKWGRPSRRQIENEITKITELLKVFTISTELRIKLEDKLFELMELGEREEPPDIEKQRQDNEPQPPVPGQEQPKEMGTDLIPYAKYCTCVHEDLNKDYTIQEWLGFDYGKFKEHIMKFLEEDKFPFLAASNQLDEIAGLLSKTQIEELRKILKEGFEKGHSVNQMAKAIKEKVQPPTKYVQNKDGTIKLNKDGTKKIGANKDVRPYTIARTETVRAAAQGSLNNYKDAGIKKVQWIAAMSERTCPECMFLNNQIFTIEQANEKLPAHVACRCAYAPVIE